MNRARPDARAVWFACAIAIGCGGAGPSARPDRPPAGEPLFSRLGALSLTLSVAATRLAAFQLEKELGTRPLFDALVEYDEHEIAELRMLRAGDVVAEADALGAASAASIVMLTDLHSDRPIQQRAIALLDHMRAASDRPKVFMFELIDANYQADVDAFFAGTISSDQLRAKVHFDDVIGADRWAAYLELLDYLKQHRVKTIVCLRSDEKLNLYDIRTRDRYVADRVARELAEDPRAQVFVLHGRSHLIGKTHLHDLLHRAHPGKTVLFLTALPSIHWQLHARGVVPDRSLYVAVDGGLPGTYYLHTVAPTVREVDFASWLSENLSTDPAVKAQLSDAARPIAPAYGAVVAAIARRDLAAAGDALTELEAHLARWAEAVSGAAGARPELVDALAETLAALRAGASR